MKHPVIAIGLDSVEPRLLERWMEKGHLKTLNQLRLNGAYGRLNNTVEYADGLKEQSATEASWTAFLSGCSLTKTGYWGTVKYHANNYKATQNSTDGSYDFKDYPLFYALGDDYKVVSFDMPTAKHSDHVNGIQIKNWGGHFPFEKGWSDPSEVLPQIVKDYGENPILFKDHGYWWDQSYIDNMEVWLKSSAETRSKICQDLLQRDNWDLFLTTFVDTHSAGHSIWHLSQDTQHPLYPYKGKDSQDPMLESFNQVDQAVGEILAKVPEDAYVICFGVHGMGNNVTDIYSSAVLPELMYRYNFPGEMGISPGRLDQPLRPIVTKPPTKAWSGHMWRSKYEANPLKQLLRRWTPSRYLKSDPQPGWMSPHDCTLQKKDLGRMPAQWCSPLWPQMKIFAIPSYSDGHLRINLKGRERDGIVSPEDYDSLCKEVIYLMEELVDARTGEPIVEDVIRTRKSPTSPDHPSLPDADLIVKWREDKPADAVDSPKLGRVGPMPFYRTGGHRSNGFVLAKGPGITPNSTVNAGHILDLSPTILKWMGAPIPEYFDGKPLF